MFETRSKADERFFRDIYFSLTGTGIKIYRGSFEILYVALTAFSIVKAITFHAETGTHYVPYYLIIAFGVIVAVVFPLILYCFTPRRYAKISAARLRETCGTDDIEFITSFEDEGISIVNSANGNKVLLRYADLTRFVDNKQYYLIGTVSKQYAIINKNQLSESDTAAMLALLKEKSNIKKLK